MQDRPPAPPASSSDRGRLIIVGGEGGTNIGGSLHRAADKLGVPSTLLNTAPAFGGPWAIARFNWWIRGHRPSRLRAFSREVVATCRRVKPKWLVATGTAPIDRSALGEIQSSGIRTISFLSDDPWNPSTRSQWFLDALPAYDDVFSARRANLADLRRHGCSHVEYLPFGVDPDLFFPEELSPTELLRHRSDVFFAGGADGERVPFIAGLIRAGIAVGLYGDYWHRYPETRAIARGHAPPDVVRKGIRAAAVCLCLVRHANRDGHSMRTFEVPAAGGCMLAEDTDEHRALFGPDGEAVVYFRTVSEMVGAARSLLSDPGARARLAGNAHRIVTEGSFTYLDRLRTMLGDGTRVEPSLPQSLTNVV